MSPSPRPPWETDERVVYRDRFGEEVEAYDRTRPVAPDDVFDDIVRMAGLSAASRVLEIGPGTGQATRRLAQRRLQIVAVEIDGRLAARLRRNLAEYPNVDVRESSFEEFDAGDVTFDAVVACNSFHWLDRDVRFVKCAALLRAAGHLVILSTPVVIPDDDPDPFWSDVQDDW